MQRNRRERGEGQIGCLIGLVILLICGLIAYKMVPVKVKSAEMRDIVQDSARAAGTMNDGAIRQAVLHKAQQLQLPIGENDIQVERERGEIRVEVSYTVPVTFPGYTYQWKFHHKAQNPIF